jgi:Ran GTPase-activating protein 1
MPEPLDENNPEGEDLDDKAKDDNADNENELESRLKNLEIKQED